ncbi:MAG: hypothetical protein IJO73_02340 [Clostridia bacterium]|nr:hypothetical protein [Clostridia bacterium]
MSKQDRQAVRTAADLQMRLGGGKNPSGNSSELELKVQQMNQTMNQYMSTTNAKLNELGQAQAVSPDVKIEDIEGGHRITITDKDGTESFDVMDGAGPTDDGISSEELDKLLENKADLEDGKVIPSQLPEFIGDIYTAYKSVQITTAGIDTLTDGASVTVPKGVYIITASAGITTGTSSGTRNNQIRILAGNTSLGTQRVFVAAQNYGALQISAVYKATTETTLTVQKSSSIPENAASGTTITALRIVSGGTSSGATSEEIAELLKNKADLVGGKVPAEQLPAMPTKISEFENDKGYLTEHQSLEGYAKTSDIPIIPEWARAENKPVYTSDEVGADAEGTASNLVSAHNTGTDAHNDIRLLIQGLSDRVNAIANSEDTDLDDFKEVVAYIKNNKSLIDAIASSKVNVADIVNNLTTNVTDRPLSAAMGVALLAMIEAIKVPTKVSELNNDIGYLTQHQDLSAYAKKNEIPTVPTNISAFNNDEQFMTKTEVEAMFTAFVRDYLGGYKWRVGTVAETGYVTVKKG